MAEGIPLQKISTDHAAKSIGEEIRERFISLWTSVADTGAVPRDRQP
jgi:hypothetical protein